ncbi:ribokinase [Faecalimonas umbilicata]|uniref:ribokinase n=1 Tax=Faecalimonas umbilicata TaxID=1912855 RepID=UPI002A809F62|nr:ribokinase [Faecalimonas umbilicata]MDY4596745.1 ribokinase [Faecalimonas umbilicata]
MKLAVVGSINMDMTVTAERIPLKGETLLGDSIHYIPGGKGANQAVAMARLGAEVEMFGCVGDDSNGEKLLENLRKEGVGTRHIKVLKEVPTGIALITVGENDNTIIVVPGANGQVDQIYADSIKEELKAFDMVVLQQEIPLETVHDLICFCAENGIKVILNPAPAAKVPLDIIEKVTYLTPNEHEAVLIFGEEETTEELLKKYPEKLVITQGSRGVSVCGKNGEVLTVPARPAIVADTTGAGDTLNGAFSVQIAKGEPIAEALRYANTAASLSTEKFGAQGGMPTAEEVERELKRNEEKIG